MLEPRQQSSVVHRIIRQITIAGFATVISVATGASVLVAENVIEEVIITAQKREQSLQEVPIAVAAYSAETLKNAGVEDIRDLTMLSPSLILSSSASETAGTVARIRGVGTTGDNAGLESAVAVFIDGVYRNRNNVALTDLGNVERIEVLRGPQGTLFGKNASAGLIHIITKSPNTEEFEGYFEGSAGSYDFYRLSGGVSGPVFGDKLAASFDMSVTERDGYIEDLLTGDDYNTRDRVSYRGQIFSQLTDNLDVRIIADYSDRDETCCAAVTILDGPTRALIAAVGGTIISPADPFERKTTANRERGFDQQVEEWGVSAEFNWDLGFADLTSITAYRDWDAARSQDIDYTNADIFYRGPGTNSNRFETLTQELRLAGDAGPIEWLVGLYFVDETLTLKDAIRTGEDYEAYIDLLLGGATGLPNTLSFFSGIPAGFVFLDGMGAQQDLFEQQSDNIAAFTHNSWHMTDQLTISLGLRYTKEDKDLQASLLADNPGCNSMAAQLGGLIPPPSGILPPAGVAGLTCVAFFNTLVDGDYSGSRSDEEWTGSVNIAYDFAEEWMAYVSYGRGFKAGGFNLDRAGFGNPLLGLTPSATDLKFGAETVDAYEIGAKGTLFENRLSVNLAVFREEFDDFQLNTFTGISFIVENLSEVTSKGVELELVGHATDNLTLTGGITYTDARYADTVSNPALAGNRLTNSPLWSASGGAHYERPVMGSVIGFADLNFRLTSDMNTGSDLDIEKVQPSFAVFNAKLGLGSEDGTWKLEFWARNLFDKNYIQIAFDAPFQGSGTGPGSTQSFNAFLGDPRTIGSSVSFNF